MKLPKDPSKLSFGATSSTVTSLGIIFGLLTSGNPKASIIGSLLVIAVADNIADSACCSLGVGFGCVMFKHFEMRYSNSLM